MDEVKKQAAKRFVLPVEQVRYYGELNSLQRKQVARDFGKQPSRESYVYAVRRDGLLVWGQCLLITDLERGY